MLCHYVYNTHTHTQNPHTTTTKTKQQQKITHKNKPKTKQKPDRKTTYHQTDQTNTQNAFFMFCCHGLTEAEQTQKTALHYEQVTHFAEYIF